jgi:diguanylate cyclase (GGDEF)-like protein
MLLLDGDMRLKVVCHRGLSDHFAYHHQPDLARNATLARIVNGGETIRLGRPEEDPEAMADLVLEEPAASVLAVPVRSAAAGIGCLVSESAEPDAFDERDAKLCRVLAHMAFACYDRCTLREQQRHLLITDPETGCYSLEFFRRRLAEEIARAERFGHPLTVGILQLDHLDAYGQTHGRREAMFVLSQVVHLLAENLRPIDTIARYHHNQLVVSLPGTDEAGSRRIADRIREALAEQKLPHPEPHLTATAGAAHYRRGDTAEELVERARRALYRAELEGGNRTVGASDI